MKSFTLQDFVAELDDLLAEVQQLRCEVAELREYRTKYAELLDSSLAHNRAMVGGLLTLATKSWAPTAVLENSDDASLHRP